MLFKVLFLLLISISALAGATLSEIDSTHSDFSAETLINKSFDYGDHWFGTDKGKHFVGSLILTTFTSHALQRFSSQSQGKSRSVAVGMTFSLGLAKEIRDHYTPGNHFSWKDLMADIAGIGLGALLLGVK